MIKFLIANGALAEIDNYGQSVLHTAVDREDLDLVKYLVENGYRKDIRQLDIEQVSPAELAKAKGSDEVEDYLRRVEKELIEASLVTSNKSSWGEDKIITRMMDIGAFMNQAGQAAGVLSERDCEILAFPTIKINKDSLDCEYILEFSRKLSKGKFAYIGERHFPDAIAGIYVANNFDGVAIPPNMGLEISRRGIQANCKAFINQDRTSPDWTYTQCLSLTSPIIQVKENNVYYTVIDDKNYLSVSQLAKYLDIPKDNIAYSPDALDTVVGIMATGYAPMSETFISFPDVKMILKNLPIDNSLKSLKRLSAVKKWFEAICLILEKN
jgi:hypothetical protein